MTHRSGHDLLEHLLRNEAITEADLLAFLATTPSDEGLHLDFKHGRELEKKPKERSFTVRQYVTAFANSDGGVLAIGIEDKTKALAPITPAHEADLGKDPRSWAKDCVADLVSYFGVQPRFVSVDLSGGGKVLLVAVARAPMLMPIRNKDGREVYYFRIEDDARAADPYLVSDLLLGRRQRPLLTGRVVSARAKIYRNGPEFRATLSLDLGVINESLLTAPSVRCGVMFQSDMKGEPAPKVLLRFADVEEQPPQREMFLRHFVLTWTYIKADASERPLHVDIRPFEERRARFEGQWMVPCGTETGDRATAAVYLVPEGSEPTWLQLEIDLTGECGDNIEIDVPAALNVVVGSRPLVSYFGRSRTGSNDVAQ